jgi:lipopolysaccharide/colanic/teichoic acid biosynthesis glycosyltransferase
MSRLYLSFFKRALDLSLSIGGLVLALPLLVVCSIAIKLDSPGPSLFRQIRIGRHGQPFVIFKFRTMVASSGASGSKITASGDPRVTRIGRWLRATKLDEVPQLFNVLRGDMSLVGPRPELPEYVAGYSPNQKRILEFKPGITGPASLGFIREEELLADQANPDLFYRYSILPRKLALDLAYCTEASFGHDLRLLLLTVVRVLSHGENNSQLADLT